MTQPGENDSFQPEPLDAEDDSILGTPEGDGDFESDGLPTVNETSAGGQLDTQEAEKRRQHSSRQEVPGPQRAVGAETTLEKTVDQISRGTILP